MPLRFVSVNGCKHGELSEQSNQDLFAKLESTRKVSGDFVRENPNVPAGLVGAKPLFGI